MRGSGKSGVFFFLRTRRGRGSGWVRVSTLLQGEFASAIAPKSATLTKDIDKAQTWFGEGLLLPRLYRGEGSCRGDRVSLPGIMA